LFPSVKLLGEESLNTWSLSHNVGMTTATSLFSTSLKTFYQAVPLGGFSVAEIFSAIDSKGSIDMVFYVAYIDTQTLVEIAENYPTTTFLVCVEKYTEYDNYTRDNIVYYWAEVYQVWFLSGYLAGLMTKPGDSEICYIKSLNDTYNTLLLNSFSYGVQMANPKVTVRYWLADTYVNNFVLQQLAQSMLQSGYNCSQLATTGFSMDSAARFVNAGRFVR